MSAKTNPNAIAAGVIALAISMPGSVLAGGASPAGAQNHNAATSTATEVVSLARVSATDDALQCKAETGGTDKLSAANGATVHVKVPSDVQLKSYDVKSGATTKTDASFDPAGFATVEGVTAGTAVELDVTVSDSKVSKDVQVACKITVAAPSPPKPLSATSMDPQKDVDAIKYWQASGADVLAKLQADGRLKGLPANTQFLVHLPSGAPAFPFPSSLREGVPLQVVVLLPGDTTEPVTLNLMSCADIQTFRIKPTDNSGKQAATETMVAVPVGGWFRCGAGTTTYSLSFGTGDTARTATTNLRMRPVYHFAANFVLGYDWAPTASFDKSSQGGSQHVVENDGKVGLAGYIGGVWMMGGVDYEDMRWYNYFANPFIAVNPASPTKDALVGVALTPTGGISVAVGVSLHERTVLNGYAVGDAFMGDGTVPTKETWSGAKPGLFLGVTVDSNVYNAVKALGSSN